MYKNMIKYLILNIYYFFINVLLSKKDICQARHYLLLVH